MRLIQLKIYPLLILFMAVYKPAFAASGGTPYFEIATPFVVNLADENTTAFLQVNAQLKVKDENLKPHLHTHMPAIQHSVMMVLSEQTSNEVRSVAGKQKLRERTLEEIQAVMTEKTGQPIVDEVYFTGFIIQ